MAKASLITGGAVGRGCGGVEDLEQKSFGGTTLLSATDKKLYPTERLGYIDAHMACGEH